MARFSKTISIVFFLLHLCSYRQAAFARQPAYSVQDSLAADENERNATGPEDAWAENETTASGEETHDNYNERHFHKADKPPATVKRGISDADWHRLTQDPAFRYEDEREKMQPQEAYKPGWWERVFAAIFEFLGSAAGKATVIGVVVLIVLVLVFRIFQLNGNIFFSKKDKNLAQDAADPEHHVPDDWEKEIGMAAQSGNYRLALRYSYRYLLLMLQEKEKIRYEVAKTNYQYVYELKGTDLYKPVMQLTRAYEYAWYGGFDIEKRFFDNYQSMIADIKKALKY